jgi:hypothetical protein
LSREQREQAAHRRIAGRVQEFAPAGSPRRGRCRGGGVSTLFIIVYRDRPVLQLPFRLLAALMNVDELLTLALPARAHGAADDRRQDRHRRVYRPRLLHNTAARHRVFSGWLSTISFRARCPSARDLEDAMGLVRQGGAR